MPCILLTFNFIIFAVLMRVLLLQNKYDIDQLKPILNLAELFPKPGTIIGTISSCFVVKRR